MGKKIDKVGGWNWKTMGSLIRIPASVGELVEQKLIAEHEGLLIELSKYVFHGWALHRLRWYPLRHTKRKEEK